MAKYENYTDKQKTAIDQLMKEAALYKKQMARCQEKLKGDILITFEENMRTRKNLRQFERKYRETTSKINDILKAKDRFNELIRKGDEIITEAETLKTTWGF